MRASSFVSSEQKAHARHEVCPSPRRNQEVAQLGNDMLSANTFQRDATSSGDSTQLFCQIVHLRAVVGKRSQEEALLIIVGLLCSSIFVFWAFCIVVFLVLGFLYSCIFVFEAFFIAVFLFFRLSL